MLNNDQAQVIQETYQSYQALVAHCKQHNLDINTILSPPQKKQLKGGMEFLKTWMPEVKKVMKAMDIPEPTFVDAVAQWRDAFIGKLKKLSKENANVSILAAKLKDNIFLGNSSFAINQQILLPMLNGIISNAADQDVANLCATIQNALETQLTNAIINDHYNNNKGGGKGKKKKSGYIDDTKSSTEIITSLPSIDDIIEGILDSRDLNDEDHPDKKAEEKAKRAEFDKAFDDWQLKMMDELGKADTASDDSLASYAKLEKELDRVFSQSDAKLLNDYLEKEVEAKVKVKKGITVIDLRYLLRESVKNSHEAIAMGNFFENWKALPKLRFPGSAAFRGALTRSKLDVSYPIFKDKVNLVTSTTQAQVIDTVAGANQKKWEKVADSREVKFKKAALISEFELAFGQIEQGVKPVGFVYDALVSELNGASKEIPLDEVKAIWKSALAKAKATAYKGEEGSAYKTWVDTLGLWQVEFVLDSIESSFPNVDIVTAVLEEALVRPKGAKKEVKPTLKDLNREDAVAFNGEIVWNNVPSLFQVAFNETMEESLTSKLIAEPKDLTTEELEAREEILRIFEEMSLASSPLESISSFLNVHIDNFKFKLNVPLKLVENYSNNGKKYVTAKPDLSKAEFIVTESNGYYSHTNKGIYTKTNLPIAGVVVGESNITGTANQTLVVSIEVGGPGMSKHLSFLAGAEMNKQPKIYTLNFEFLITSGFSIKQDNPQESKVTTRLRFIETSIDTGQIVNNVRGTTTVAELPVYKKK
ncbi:MAG: hypothetical protein GY810_24620 [Aureispira sp.]|nr:hypothetical protein [Aureispira sp.]